MPFGEIGDKITVGADDLIEECTDLGGEDDDDDDLTEDTDLGGGDDGWHNGPAPLHQVVQVPGGEQDPGLVALVRVDGVTALVPAPTLVVFSLAAELSSKE